MILTNNQIFTYANQLMTNFADASLLLPIQVNFYLLKNKKQLIDLAKEIDEARLSILQKYGIENKDTGEFSISKEKAEIALLELNTLFALEQDVSIYTVSLEELKAINVLTLAQMEALMFMIKEE